MQALRSVGKNMQALRSVGQNMQALRSVGQNMVASTALRTASSLRGLCPSPLLAVRPMSTRYPTVPPITINRDLARKLASDAQSVSFSSPDFCLGMGLVDFGVLGASYDVMGGTLDSHPHYISSDHTSLPTSIEEINSLYRDGIPSEYQRYIQLGILTCTELTTNKGQVVGRYAPQDENAEKKMKQILDAGIIDPKKHVVQVGSGGAHSIAMARALAEKGYIILAHFNHRETHAHREQDMAGLIYFAKEISDLNKRTMLSNPNPPWAVITDAHENDDLTLSESLKNPVLSDNDLPPIPLGYGIVHITEGQHGLESKTKEEALHYWDSLHIASKRGNTQLFLLGLSPYRSQVSFDVSGHARQSADAVQDMIFESVLAMASEVGKDQIRFWNMLKTFVPHTSYQPIHDNVTILNVACGRASETLAINSFFGGEKVDGILSKQTIIYGIDIDEEALEAARKHWAHEIFQNLFIFFNSDATSLSSDVRIPDSDVAFIRHQQISDNEETWTSIFSEVHKKVRPGGLILITSYSDVEHEMLSAKIEELGQNIVLNARNPHGKKLYSDLEYPIQDGFVLAIMK